MAPRQMGRHAPTTDDVDHMVRCNGLNSGHTVNLEGQKYELKQVTAGLLVLLYRSPGTRLLVAPGSPINPRTFLTSKQNIHQCLGWRRKRKKKTTDERLPGKEKKTNDRVRDVPLV